MDQTVAPNVEANNLVEVDRLSIALESGDLEVVKSVSFSVAPREIVGIVGESGSGKTQVARAIMGLIPPGLKRLDGDIRFEGHSIANSSNAELRRLRGARIGMVFQEPMTSLNPSMKIGRQLDEGLALHNPELKPEERRHAILGMLARVGIADPNGALDAWPHEFSGGMRQRMMLASVMLLKPSLLIADEPTTALDAVVQRDVLELMVDLTRENDTAVLLISHDLPMVARYTERVIVMRHGLVVEQGSTQQLLSQPKEAYTRELLASMPRRGDIRTLQPAQPLVEVQDLVVEYPGRHRFLGRTPGKKALEGVTLAIQPGEVVAVVGGSGSGKTTLGRAIAGLLPPTSGTIRFNGKPIDRNDQSWRQYRLDCQMVFQDPFSSLNPRLTIGQLVGEGLRLTNMTANERRDRTEEILREVGLADRFAKRFPHQLSGGQRQRVAIARALVRRPRFVVADEPVSALDVTVRAQVLELFADLQRRHGFSCVFISHDLSVVEQIADRVIVMQNGQIVEQGPRDQVFDSPQHAYTRKLLSAIPLLETNPEGGVRLRWRFDAPLETSTID